MQQDQRERLKQPKYRVIGRCEQIRLNYARYTLKNGMQYKLFQSSDDER